MIKPEIKSYEFQGMQVQLELHKNVFAPSPFTQLFAKNIRVNPGETVIDIGTGTGALAILAAKFGGHVWATDIYPEPIECAKKNAQLNSVKISFRKGEFLQKSERNLM